MVSAIVREATFRQYLRRDHGFTELNVASSVYSRTLQKAAELIGGRQKLARHLRVPLAELDKWIAGTAVPPIATFLKAVDLVIDETPPPAGSASEPGDPPAPRESSAVRQSY